MCDSNNGKGGCYSCSSQSCTLSLIAKVLLIIGGINWGLVGAGMLAGADWNAWNVVSLILGSVPVAEAVVYVIVGVAAIVSIFGCKCKKCAGSCDSCEGHDQPGSIQ